MEILRGKAASLIAAAAFHERLQGYDTLHIDLGTGDGRYVQHSAPTCPNTFFIGIDACRENLHEVSRRAQANTLFVIANAQALPLELTGLATQMTINFPWGSLMEGLLTHNTELLASVAMIARLDASLELRLNGGALGQAGWSLEEGAYQVREVLEVNGFKMRSPMIMTAQTLKSCPTTWAKRLAYGRDPRAMYLSGVRRG
ncbi:MAG: hypothetical protein H7X77_08065 [Anaerolineae bacterium]|nr:hypothetical protein [Anaerolineae bacterium]